MPTEPPAFVQLLAHPVRWALLEELTRSDRAVRELTQLVDEPQNLVSYHLRLLKDGGLVSSHRSSADGRDSYYAIDLAHCRDAMQATGGALHPGLWLVPAPAAPVRPSGRQPRVLFLCTGNSARSQIAEALLADMSNHAVDVASAGSAPKPLHPNAVRVLRTRGIDISQNRTKHFDELARRRFDVVVTLCDHVREVCPEYPHSTRMVHWSIPDPALEGPTNRASYPAFGRTAAELETRIGFLLAQLHDPPSRRLQHARR
ncbi:MAG TPA: helix-turn-helix domain-containing protein [Acidimicrobiia bacterium]|nr:helix-turn-helix domain-containing protein [Acidimicrobiia bacterium]